MNITRLEPYGIFNLLNRGLEPMAGHHFLTRNDGDELEADWAPAVDIVENKDNFVLLADLPGVAADAIDIHMEKGVLIISGERQTESESDYNGMKRLERTSGRFIRRFSLPDSADAENISARSTNGTLEITIPKLAEILHRRITVEAA